MREIYRDVWKDFDEKFLLQLLEAAFKRQGYAVENLHETDRPHESGIDLLCQKDQEGIALQAKIKPRKSDIDQFKCFVNNTEDKKAIYVHIQSPTRSFMSHTQELHSRVEFWTPLELHDFLVSNEITEYLSLCLSRHPMVLVLTKVHNLISDKRRTGYTVHRLSARELATLWSAKDNAVKACISLYFIYCKWNAILMAKTTIDRDEFEPIMQSIFDDLDLAYTICGTRLTSSFEDLSERYPNILGLLWELATHRTNWSSYTTHIDTSDSQRAAEHFTLYHWVCPVFDDFSLIARAMRGFYSTLSYLLENLKDMAKNLEDALDWTFAETNRSQT